MSDKIWIEKRINTHVLFDLDNTVRPATKIEIDLWNRIEELETQLKTHMEIAVEAEQNYFHIKAQLEAVREYLQHREACTIYDPMVKGEVCTCGLEAAIGEGES